MAFPQKNSRTIVVGEEKYRWHLFIDDDQPWTKEVAILAEGNRNGACLRAFHEAESVTPSTIRRIIEAGLADGWTPDADASGSRWLSAQQATECFKFFERELKLMGSSYLWSIDQKGGLHFKIRSASVPKGQLLATLGDVEGSHANDEIAAAFISKAIDLGWKSEQAGLDCFWLDANVCSEVLSEIGLR